MDYFREDAVPEAAPAEDEWGARPRVKKKKKKSNWLLDEPPEASVYAEPEPVPEVEPPEEDMGGLSLVTEQHHRNQVEEREKHQISEQTREQQLMKDHHTLQPKHAGLQLHDSRNALDIVDKLRSSGISRYIDLPQIIVCGDQSSGKSSVLEALSGATFPTKDTLCTRFATELILRRSSEHGAKQLNVSIIPGKDRSPEQREKLKKFAETGSTDLDLAMISEKATKAMGLDDLNKVFCNDILRIELSGPEQLHLTLVDLPGLFLAGTKDQSMEDAAVVESLVMSYMDSPRTIILAVVSAKSEFALQQVIQRARERDPNGDRTLGLITKPDTLDVGSDGERKYLELAQNKDVAFRLGWHVVKNKDFNQRNDTLAQRNQNERHFFSEGVWTSLHDAHLGIESLKTRLASILHRQILAYLPPVIEEIQLGVSQCRSDLEKLGERRSTSSQQRRYLLKLSHSFTSILKSAVDGDYGDRAFFGDPETPAGSARRLRARIQALLHGFEKAMRLYGHAKQIVEDGSADPNKAASSESNGEKVKNSPSTVTRSKYVDHVAGLMRRVRGRELPGTFNPLIVGELFNSQCKPWQYQTAKCVGEVHATVRGVLAAILEQVADVESRDRLECELLDPAMATFKKIIEKKTAELLKPHLESHPITYNHYLTDNIQAARTARDRKKVRKALEGYFRSYSLTAGQAVPEALVSAMLTATEPNMETFAAQAAVETMEAYYKVALKKFVDDVSVLAIEQCFLAKLSGIFSTDVVCDLSDDDLRRLVGESAGIGKERSRLTEKLRVLEEGLLQLNKLSQSS